MLCGHWVIGKQVFVLAVIGLLQKSAPTKRNALSCVRVKYVRIIPVVDCRRNTFPFPQLFFSPTTLTIDDKLNMCYDYTVCRTRILPMYIE